MIHKPVIQKNYKTRPVRFMELYQHGDWMVKIYSISVKHEVVDHHWIEQAKHSLETWLKQADSYQLDTYKTATLILHEGKEGCFAILCWWIDENMLQLFVYLANDAQPDNFILYSDKGIITCVWEMAVLWFERNAWVEHVLMKADKPDIESYLNTVLNEDV